MYLHIYLPHFSSSVITVIEFSSGITKSSENYEISQIGCTRQGNSNFFTYIAKNMGLRYVL